MSAPAAPGETRTQAWRRWRRLATWCGALALVALAAFAGYQLALQTGLDRLRQAADHRLDMLATGLDADLARFEYLPALLEMTPIVPSLLDATADLRLRDSANRYLSGVNATAGAEMLYVLDPKGIGVAASDWDQPGTTIGQDYSFRPYFTDALLTGRGRFYGVGVTSRKPGYYLSYALRSGDRLRGIVAVKIDIEEAENSWRKLPGHVLLIDQRAVVILSTRKDLKYRPLVPLTAAQREEVARTRPYGQATLQPLNWILVKTLAPDAQLIALDGVAHLASARPLKQAPWRLVTLDELAPVRTMARYTAISASLAMAVLLLIAVTLWQRRRAVRQKLASQAALQAAHDSLEATVVARTAQLRAAQNQLVHAGKMAAMGEMSAVMVHELNQPLTALRTLSESAGILLEQGRAQEVRGNLERIAAMVDRLARLTSRLKTFSHKDDVTPGPVPLAHAIADARAVLAHELKEQDVAVEVEVQPADLSALAEEAALGSVFVNLMRNAIDVMRSVPQRRLQIAARSENGRAVIAFADSGPGIRADILPRLFEPFVTTKPAGAGLGLGLVISMQLVRALGGTLRAFNRAEGGACFVIDLPLAGA